MASEEKSGVSPPDPQVFLRAETRKDEHSPWTMVAAGRDRHDLRKKAPAVITRTERNDPLARVRSVNAFDEAERLYRPHAKRAEQAQIKDGMPGDVRASFAPMREISKFESAYEGLTYVLKSCQELATVDFSRDPDVDVSAFTVLFVWGETK